MDEVVLSNMTAALDRIFLDIEVIQLSYFYMYATHMGTQIIILSCI